MSSPLKGKKEIDDFDGYCDEHTPYKFSEENVQSATDWILQILEDEIDKAIEDYHKMILDNVHEELITEDLLLMYINTTYGCIQTVEAGLEDAI